VLAPFGACVTQSLQRWSRRRRPTATDRTRSNGRADGRRVIGHCSSSSSSDRPSCCCIHPSNGRHAASGRIHSSYPYKHGVASERSLYSTVAVPPAASDQCLLTTLGGKEGKTIGSRLPVKTTSGQNGLGKV